MPPIRKLSAFGKKLGKGRVKATWLWDASIIASRPDQVINLCIQNKINTIYAPYDTTKATVSQYQYFISKANDNGIKVEALNGDPDWALTSYQANCQSWINSVISYNSSVAKKEKFQGIHLDNEPYLLTSPLNWSVLNDRVQIMNQWLVASDAYISSCHNAGLTAGCSIPFWLDDSQDVSDAIAQDSQLANFYKQIIDKWDYVAIMAYRDIVTGTNSVSDIVQNEINYPTSPKIIIGLETTNVSPDNITFYQEGFIAVEIAISQIESLYDNYSSFKGVAIHDYAQWEKFLMPYSQKTPSRKNTPARKLNPTRIN